ncbi:DUF2341 domain-containing protein, partial [archaeon]|nr:DUF2341 domain-containing protein [archaeon]MBT4441524.1 DUF2341 domain-containing protein [archaeon]
QSFIVVGNATLCTTSVNTNTLADNQAAWHATSNAILDCNQSTFTGTTGNNNRAGMQLLYSWDNTTIKNCKFNTYGFGIKVDGDSTSNNASHHKLIGNTLTSNTYGIYHDEGTYYNQFINNTLSSNNYNIYFDDNNDYNQYINNSIKNSNVDGIWFDRSSNNYNNFTGNNISNNGNAGDEYGVQIDSSSNNNNKFFGNYFSGNYDLDVSDFNGGNTYSVTPFDGGNIMGGNKIGGNYWENVQCVDHGMGPGPYYNTSGDGICDGLGYTVTDDGGVVRSYDSYAMNDDTTGCAKITDDSNHNDQSFIVVGNATLCTTSVNTNTLTDNYHAWRGISNAILDCNQSTFTGTTNNNNRFGFRLYQSTDNITIKNCKFNTYGRGIYVDGDSTSNNASHNKLIGNTLTSNTYGIYHEDGTYYNQFINNTLSSNNYNIYFDDNNDYNQYINNSIKNSNIQGIHFDRSSNNYNNFTGNNISNNGNADNEYGVLIDNDNNNNNKFFGNYFSGNYDLEVSDYNGGNSYSVTPFDGGNIMGGNKIGGNYWDHVQCVDHGMGPGPYYNTSGDGICDGLGYTVTDDIGYVQGYDYYAMNDDTTGCAKITDDSYHNDQSFMVVGNATLCTTSVNTNTLADNYHAWRGISNAILDCNQSTFTGTTANSNRFGFRLYQSTDNITIKNCKFNTYGRGIYVDGDSLGNNASHNKLIGNTITSNTYGTYEEFSYYNQYINNTFSSNNYNLYLYEDNYYNKYINNSIKDSTVMGVFLDKDYNKWNNFTGNNISGNGDGDNEYNVRIDNSNNLYNYFTNNYFSAKSDDLYHIYDDNANNYFSVAPYSTRSIINGPKTGGNYWDDYTGVDSDGDGIGQTSYNSGIYLATDSNPLARYDGCMNLSNYYTWGNNITQVGEDFYIQGSINLCYGEYNLTDSENNGAIIINADNIYLDFNGSKILGNTTGTFIYSNKTNLTLFNASIDNFSKAIHFEDANNTLIEYFKIKNNSIYLTNSQIDFSFFEIFTEYVNIEYSALNITKEQNTTNNIRLIQNFTILESNNIDEFNSSAKLTFYNISGVDVPSGFRNGAKCGAKCTNVVTLGGNNYTMNVTGFTNYTITQGNAAPVVNTVENVPSPYYKVTMALRANITDSNGQADIVYANYTVTAQDNTKLLENFNATTDLTFWNSSTFTLNQNSTYNYTLIVKDTDDNFVTETGTLEFLIIPETLSPQIAYTNNPYTTYGSVNFTNGTSIENSSVNVFLDDQMKIKKWWDSDWKYRKEIVLTEESGSNLSDYQVQIDISDLIYNNSGLVASWHFNEGTGTRYIGSSKYQRENYSIGGDPSYVAGVSGTALDFDGNDRLIVAYDSSIGFSQYTISVWMKPDASNTGWRGIFGKKGRNYNFWYNSDDDYVHHRYCDDANYNSGADNTPSGSIIKGEWNFVTLTNDGVNSSTYLNGVLNTTGITTGSLCINSTVLNIARNLDEADSAYFIGALDEMKMHNISLQPEEIKHEFCMGAHNLYLLGDISEATFDSYNCEIKSYNYTHQDLRVVDQSGNELPFYLEGDTNLWVKTDLTANINTSIFVYYGNPSAAPSSNGDDVFLLFDDFNSGTLDETKWNVTVNGNGNVTVNHQQAEIDDGSNTGAKLRSYANVSHGVLESRLKWTDSYELDLDMSYGWNGTIAGRMGMDLQAWESPHGVYNGTTWTNGTKYLSNTYKDLKLISAVGNQTSIYDGEIVQGFNTTVNLDPVPIYFNMGNNLPTLILDYVRVREFASTEPSFTFNTQQNSSTYLTVNGEYNYTLTAPSDGGSYTIKVNTSVSGIYGQNSQVLTVYQIPTVDTVSFFNRGWMKNLTIQANITDDNLDKVNFTITRISDNTKLIDNQAGTNLANAWNSTSTNITDCTEHNYTIFAYDTDNFNTTSTGNITFLCMTVNLNPSSLNLNDSFDITGYTNLTNGTVVTDAAIFVHYDENSYGSSGWWNSSWEYRTNLTVDTGYAPRGNNSVTKMIINFTQLMSDNSITGNFDPNSIRVTDSNGNLVDSEITRWFGVNRTGMLRWKMSTRDTITKETNYSYYLYFDTFTNGVKQPANASLPKEFFICSAADAGNDHYYAYSTYNRSLPSTWTKWDPESSNQKDESTIADFDNDGDLDIVYTSDNANSAYVYSNDGDASWSFTLAQTITSIDGDWNGICEGDFNEDGWLDLVINEDDCVLRYYENDGDGTFTYVSSPGDCGGEARKIACGEIDGDNNVDIVAGAYSNGCLYLIKGDGDGTFTDSGCISDSQGDGDDQHGVWIVDADLDGDMDVYGQSSSSYSDYFENKGDGTFENGVRQTDGGIVDSSPIQNQWGSGTVGDYDHDGSMDIIEGSWTSGTSYMAVYWGDNSLSNIYNNGNPSDKDAVAGMVDYSMFCGGADFLQDIKVWAENNSESPAVILNSSGWYEGSFTAPSAGGPYNVKLNTTYQGIYGENSQTLTVYQAPTIETVAFFNKLENQNLTIQVNITDDNIQNVNFTITKISDNTKIIDNQAGTNISDSWNSTRAKLDGCTDHNYTIFAYDKDNFNATESGNLTLICMTLNVNPSPAQLENTILISGYLNYTNSSMTTGAGVNVFVDGTLQAGLGNGSDGALTVTAAETIINNYTHLTGNETSGNTSIAVGDSSEFAANDEVLIIQMQNASGGNFGVYEFARISSVEATRVNFTKPLNNSYYSGRFNTTYSTVSQIVKVPQYTNVTIDDGATITAKLWDRWSGGIVVFKATDGVNITGSVDAEGKGFRGGEARQAGAGNGTAGESYYGLGIATADPNEAGGGGGAGRDACSQNCGAGGGGGYGTAGTVGIGSGNLQPGDPGANYNIPNLDSLIFGSAGGGGGSGWSGSGCANHRGGHGGGIVFISAQEILVSGNLTVAGKFYGTGWHGGCCDCAASGSGAGGTVYLRSSVMDFSNGIVNASGGNGVNSTAAGYKHEQGGNGGVGRIRLDVTTLSGTTHPGSGYNGTFATTVVNESGYYDYNLSAFSEGGVYTIKVNTTHSGIYSEKTEALTVYQSPSIQTVSFLNRIWGQNITIQVNLTDDNLDKSNFTITRISDNIKVLDNQAGTNLSNSWNSTSTNITDCTEHNYSIYAYDKDNFNATSSGNITFMCIDINFNTTIIAINDSFESYGTVNLTNGTNVANTDVDIYINLTKQSTSTPANWDNLNFTYRLPINLTQPNTFSSGRTQEHILLNLTLAESRLRNESGPSFYCNGTQMPYEGYAINITDGWVTQLQALVEINFSQYDNKSCYLYYDTGYNGTNPTMRRTGWHYVSDGDQGGANPPADLTPANIDCNSNDANGEWTVYPCTGSTSDTYTVNEWCYFKGQVTGTQTFWRQSDDASYLIIDGTTVTSGPCCGATTGTYTTATGRFYNMETDWTEGGGGEYVYLAHAGSNSNDIDTECYPYYGDEWTIDITNSSEESKGNPAQTNATGQYSHTLTSPSSTGEYPVKFNTTYSGIYGERTVSSTVKARPSVTLTSPINANYSVILESIKFNCTVTDTDGDLSNITLYHDLSGTWASDGTASVTGSSNSTVFTRDVRDYIGYKFTDSRYTWNCKATDEFNLDSQASTNVTFGSWNVGNYSDTLLNVSSGYLGLDDSDSIQELNSTWFNLSGNGLLLHMNEASGTIIDSSGNGNDGSDSGGINYSAEGKLNTAIGFDGDNDYINIGDITDFDDLSELTLSAWFYLEGNSSTSTPGGIIDKFDVSGDERNILFTETGGNLRISVGETGGVGDYCYVITPLKLNRWYHGAATFDSGDCSLYLDGALTGSASAPEGETTTGSNSAPLRIGSSNDFAGSGSGYFNGSIDEVAVWTRTLSANEITELYNRQKGTYLSRGNYTSRVFDAGRPAMWKNMTWDENAPYYEELPDNQEVETATGGVNMTGNVLLMHFNNDSTYGENNTNAFDFSGNKINGTLGNLSQNTIPSWTSSGKLFGALDFDGEDYVSFGDSLDSTTTGEDKKFSYSVWIKPESPLSTCFIIGKVADSSCSESQRQYFLRLSSSGVLDFLWYGALDASSYRGVKGTTYITDLSKWHHVVVNYDGSIDTNDGLDRVEIYLDGVEESKELWLSSGSLLGIQDSTAHLGIGKALDPSGSACGGTNFFNGTIDEVAIWNRTLSEEEILNIYKRGALRLNFSARSCDDTICDTELLVPFGSNVSYTNISLLNNTQYFQYQLNYQADGTDFSPEISMDSVVVAYEPINNPPNVTNVTLTSTSSLNYSNGTLITAWAIQDPEGDTETDNETRWWVDGILNTTFTNNSRIEAANITKGEVWNFSVRIYDGGYWSDWSENISLTTVNAPPSISLNDPTDGEKLYRNTSPTLNISISDADSDSVDVTFLNSTLNNTICDLDNVNSTVTCTWSGLTANQVYSWLANATDGEDTVVSPVWNFTPNDEPGVNNMRADFINTSSVLFKWQNQADMQWVSLRVGSEIMEIRSITSVEDNWTVNNIYPNQDYTFEWQVGDSLLAMSDYHNFTIKTIGWNAELANYSYRRLFTVNSSEIASDQDNFAVNISLTEDGFQYYDSANWVWYPSFGRLNYTNKNDIRFVDYYDSKYLQFNVSYWNVPGEGCLYQQTGPNETAYSGDFIEVYKANDSDWDTQTTPSPTGTFLYNYTIPTGAKTSSKYRIYDGGWGWDLTLPSSCYGGDKLQFKSVADYNIPAVDTYCWNQSSDEWAKFRNNGNVSAYIYETMMTWQYDCQAYISVIPEHYDDETQTNIAGLDGDYDVKFWMYYGNTGDVNNETYFNQSGTEQDSYSFGAEIEQVLGAPTISNVNITKGRTTTGTNISWAIDQSVDNRVRYATNLWMLDSVWTYKIRNNSETFEHLYGDQNNTILLIPHASQYVETLNVTCSNSTFSPNYTINTTANPVSIVFNDINIAEYFNWTVNYTWNKSWIRNARNAEFQLESLATNTTYYYEINAYGQNGNSTTTGNFTLGNLSSTPTLEILNYTEDRPNKQLTICANLSNMSDSPRINSSIQYWNTSSTTFMETTSTELSAIGTFCKTITVEYDTNNTFRAKGVGTTTGYSDSYNNEYLAIQPFFAGSYVEDDNDDRDRQFCPNGPNILPCYEQKGYLEGSLQEEDWIWIESNFTEYGILKANWWDGSTWTEYNLTNDTDSDMQYLKLTGLDGEFHTFYITNQTDDLILNWTKPGRIHLNNQNRTEEYKYVGFNGSKTAINYSLLYMDAIYYNSSAYQWCMASPGGNLYDCMSVEYFGGGTESGLTEINGGTAYDRGRLFRGGITNGEMNDTGVLTPERRSFDNTGEGYRFCFAYTAYWWNQSIVPDNNITNYYYRYWSQDDWWSNYFGYTQSKRFDYINLFSWAYDELSYTRDWTEVDDTRVSTETAVLNTLNSTFNSQYNQSLVVGYLNDFEFDTGDDNIYNFGFYTDGRWTNQQFGKYQQAFVIFNLPDNTTLLGMDTDGDSLNDYEELFTYYTNPMSNDTDEDGRLDADEINLSYDANLYTLSNTAPNLTAMTFNASIYYSATSMAFNSTYTDYDGDSATVYLIWFKNGVNIYNRTYSNVANGTLIESTLQYPNFTRADQINLTLYAVDTLSGTSPTVRANITISNYPPSFNETLANQTVNSGQAFTYDINCSDSDGDNINYYDNTSLFNINETTGIIADTPSQTEFGNNSVEISCGDGTENTTQNIIYHINDNEDPVITLTGPDVFTTDTTPTFTLTTDEVSSCKYRNRTSNFTWMDTSGGTLHYKNLNLNYGLYEYSIECNDSSSNTGKNKSRFYVAKLMPTEYSFNTIEFTANETNYNYLENANITINLSKATSSFFLLAEFAETPAEDFEIEGQTTTEYKFFSINTGNTVEGNISEVTLRFEYDPAALIAAGIAESELTVFYYNGTTWAEESGTVNEAEDYIEITIAHLSDFVMGKSVPTAAPVTEEAAAGGGGGGGGFRAPAEVEEELDEVDEIENIEISVDSITLDAVEGFISGDSFRITNRGNTVVDLELTVTTISDILHLSDTDLTLEPGESQLIEIDVIPKQAGIYTGKINVFYKNQVLQIPVTININTERSLFDISVNVLGAFKNIRPGQKITASMFLLQAGLEQEEDVTLNYIIKDFDGNIYLTESETIAVYQQTSFNKQLPTQDLPPGEYVLGAEVVYGGGIATSSSQFIVTETELDSSQKLLLGVLIAAALTFISLVIIIERYKKLRRPYIKKRGR